jgi:hypothetical protein
MKPLEYWAIKRKNGNIVRFGRRLDEHNQIYESGIKCIYRTRKETYDCCYDWLDERPIKVIILSKSDYEKLIKELRECGKLPPKGKPLYPLPKPTMCASKIPLNIN